MFSRQDKDKVRNEIWKSEKRIDAKDIIRDLYVLEFLGLRHTPNLYDLQKFLLGLGRDFSFVARQRKITFDGEHYYINFVFKINRKGML